MLMFNNGQLIRDRHAPYRCGVVLGSGKKHDNVTNHAWHYYRVQTADTRIIYIACDNAVRF